MRQSSGSRARAAKTRFSPVVLDAGNVSGIVSAMAFWACYSVRAAERSFAARVKGRC
jgi:hypothetical protein